jgi:hypothetical protein
MGNERWYRGQQDEQGRSFDWLTAARRHGVPGQLARALYARALQQAHDATGRRVQELYLDLLRDVRRDVARPSPGKVTRTMRLQARRAGKRDVPHVSPLTDRPIAPGKRALTWYIEPSRRMSLAPEQERELPEPPVAAFRPESAMLPVDPRRTSAHMRDPDERSVAGHRQLQADLTTALGYFEDVDAPRGERIDADPSEDRAPSASVSATSLPGEMPLGQALRHTFGEAAVRIPILESAAVPENAKGATVDRRVHLAPGVADPRSQHGRRILGHEIAHALQQTRSDSARTLSPRHRTALESEADRAGLAFARGERFAVHGRAPAAAPLFFDQPIVRRAPSRAITIRDFIRLVEAEERRWPAAEQTQTALMISRLRKIFYGTSGWDDYLIPGAASISSGYDIRVEETGRENLSLPGFDADIVRSRQVTTGAAGSAPAIASQQEVQLEDGSFCDIGHVFAGLDAANHPTSITAPLGVASVTDNLGAVTWTGDLGSVLAEGVFQRFNLDRLLTDAEMQVIIDEYASPQDMLGNIDAYVMAGQYDITNRGGRKVSELLRAYYLGASGTADAQAREHRYSRFCAMTGLTGWNGTSFANEADWVNRWTPEVSGAAALYVGANTAGALGAPGRAGIIVGIQDNPLARMLVQKFLDALKVLVAAEPP